VLARAGADLGQPERGPVMAAGAGALAVQLGGAAIYHGREEQRPPLGCGAPADAQSVRRAVTLVRHGMLLWLGVVAAAALAASLADWADALSRRHGPPNPASAARPARGIAFPEDHDA